MRARVNRGGMEEGWTAAADGGAAAAAAAVAAVAAAAVAAGAAAALRVPGTEHGQVHFAGAVGVHSRHSVLRAQCHPILSFCAQDNDTAMASWAYRHAQHKACHRLLESSNGRKIPIKWHGTWVVVRA